MSWPFCPITWCSVRRPPCLFNREQLPPKFCFSDFHTELPPASICLSHAGVGNACTISPDMSCSQQRFHTAPSAFRLETRTSSVQGKGKRKVRTPHSLVMPCCKPLEKPRISSGEFTLHIYLFGLHQAGEDVDLGSWEPEGWWQTLSTLPSHSKEKNKWKRKSHFGDPPKEASSLFSGEWLNPQTQKVTYPLFQECFTTAAASATSSNECMKTDTKFHEL